MREITNMDEALGHTDMVALIMYGGIEYIDVKPQDVLRFEDGFILKVESGKVARSGGFTSQFVTDCEIVAEKLFSI